ncbi:MAG TPA: ABC transporter permease, partial [Candidatus Angelobacter sp.]
ETAARVWGQFVSGNYFAVLGIKPVLGRVFNPEEYGDKPGAFPLVVISYRFWQSRFSSDPDIAGKTIKVNQHELTIIGVTPPAFRGSMVGLAYDLWIPCMMRPQLSGFKTAWQLTDRKNRDLVGIARLKPGVTIEQAQSEIAALAAVMAKAQPWEDGGVSATILPLWKSHFGPQGLLLAPLQILMAVCAVVVLIVCANVANLLLARFTTRQKEFSMRLALGARRGRLARQLLTESLLLAAAGALLGVLMSVWLAKSLRFMMPPGEHFALNTNLSLPVLGFTALLCLATTLLCGFAPTLQSVRVNLNDNLKESGRNSAVAPRSHRMRTVLVLAEVSLALVALIGAGLFVRGFRALQKIDPGFDPDNVLLAKFSLSTSGFNIMQRRDFCFRLRERLESEPGIASVSYSDDVPLGLEPSWWEDLKIKGYQPSLGENMKIYRNVVAPGYFQLLHIPLREGRDFTEQDDDGKAPVMIVNQSFVKRFFGPGAVLGREVYGWGQWFKVIGVAKDSKYNYPTEAAIPYFYVPFRQVYRNDMYLSFYLKVRGNPEEANATLRRAVSETDPRVTFFDSFPLADYISVSLYPQKVTANLLSALGLLALVLAAVGLYSVMAYSVAQRTHEIGIRMALGAQRSNVLSLVLRQAMNLTFAGLLVGAGLALALSRKVAAISVSGSVMGGAGNLLGTGSVDPLIYFAAAIFLSAVALLASYIPARHATKVDPLIALRTE